MKHRVESRNLHCGLPLKVALVFCDKISCSCMKGFHSNENVKEEYPLQK